MLIEVMQLLIMLIHNPELQLKDNESLIKNKVEELLNKLKVFKFVMTLVLEFKK